MISILVLKDGQIVEKGNLKELLAIDGIFASMWAEQVSSADEPALSINGTGTKNEISGYIVESEETKQEHPQDISETLASITFPVASVAESAVVPNEERIDVLPAVTANEESPLPQSKPVDTVDAPDAALIVPIPVTPISLQSSVIAPVEFPTTPETPQPQTPPQPEIRRSDSPVSFTPAVTFEASVNSPPSRTGTPGPEDEPKRKRISSQNFQRLARRISLSTRRQGSVSSIIPNIPGFKRSESPMARVSTDDNDARGEGSTSTNSPASSIQGDDKGKSKKKDKKVAT